MHRQPLGVAVEGLFLVKSHGPRCGFVLECMWMGVHMDGWLLAVVCGTCLGMDGGTCSQFIRHRDSRRY